MLPVADNACSTVWMGVQAKVRERNKMFHQELMVFERAGCKVLSWTLKALASETYIMLGRPKVLFIEARDKVPLMKLLL